MVAPTWKFREKVLAVLSDGEPGQVLTTDPSGNPVWTDADGGRFDLSVFVQGEPQDGELVFRHVFAGPVTFRASLPGSRSSAGVASTGSVAFSIQKNGAEFGTITFAASATGAFAAASNTSFDDGDVLTIIAPASQDTTLADVSIALSGGEAGVADRFDLALFVQARPTDGELVSRHIFTEFVSFPAGLTDSYSTAVTASTGTAEFSLEKNGSEFGTVTFTSSATGVLAAASETVFSPGDLLTVIAPASQDATLADVSLTLTGTR